MSFPNAPFVHCSNTIIGHNVEEEDRKHTWMEDADSVGVVFVTSELLRNRNFTFTILYAMWMCTGRYVFSNFTFGNGNYLP